MPSPKVIAAADQIAKSDTSWTQCPRRSKR